MEDLYSIHPGICRSFTSGDEVSEISDPTDAIKSYISRHPKYPKLVSAYIQCIQVGATSETTMKLEEVGKGTKDTKCLEIGVDPELDVFMDSYCELLHRYKEDLSKPFDEAASFLNSVEMQLRNLSVDCTASSANDECVGSSEEELSYPDVISTSDSTEFENSSQTLEDQKLRGMLLKKYSGYLTGLRKEFSKKKKKGKLPKDARFLLLDWWKTHYRWPYPTEDEKVQLADITGLDQKQINNWFINQRKRHWKPSEEMQLALMEGVSAGSGLGTTLYFDTGTIGPGTT